MSGVFRIALDAMGGDGAPHSPVAGAVVRVDRSEASTTTDRHGQFALGDLENGDGFAVRVVSRDVEVVCLVPSENLGGGRLVSGARETRSPLLPARTATAQAGGLADRRGRTYG